MSSKVSSSDYASGSKNAAAGSSSGSGGKKVEPPREPDGIIDMDILGQVFEMDEGMGDDDEVDDEAPEPFSKGIVWNYFEQAEETFGSMMKALDEQDTAQLSSLGHFLKGSSAALGITKVKDSCEKMQHYGNLRDEESGEELTKKDALEKIRALVVVVQEEYDEARAWLERYYKEKESGGE